MKKRILTVLALLVIVPTFIFASGETITWNWVINNSQVNGFRYQLNDENLDDWIVVDGDTTKAVFENLDGSEEYSLYLQQTFDGVNWSDSSVSEKYSISGVKPVVETPIKEEVVVETPITEVVVEVPVKEVVVEVPVKEVVVEVPVKSQYYTSIGFNFGVSKDSVSSSSYHDYHEILGMTIGFNNIKTFGNHVGLGIDLDANTVGYVVAGNDSFLDMFMYIGDGNKIDQALKIAIVPEVEFTFGDFGIDFGLLGAMTFINNDVVSYIGLASAVPTFSQIEFGLFTYGIKAGFDYHVSDLSCVGFDLTVTSADDLSNTDTGYSIEGLMSYKLTF